MCCVCCFCCEWPWRRGRRGSACIASITSASPSNKIALAAQVSEESFLFLGAANNQKRRTTAIGKTFKLARLLQLSSDNALVAELQTLHHILLLQRNQSHHFQGLFQTLKHWPCCPCSCSGYASVRRIVPLPRSRKTDSSAVIDRKGHQAVTIGSASAGYSVHKEHASSRDSTVLHKHTQPIRGSGCPYPPPGCETRARTRRMCEPCWRATQQLVLALTHLFSGQCIESHT